MPTLAASDHLTEHEAAERATLVRDVRYAVDLDLTGGDEVNAGGESTIATFRSTTRATFESLRDGASTFLNINAAELLSVELNGAALPSNRYACDNSRLLIHGLVNGSNTVVVVARCAYQENGVGLHRLVDPVDRQTYVYTHFEPFDAHRVFACFDQPDLKALITTTVRAPGRWEICANGRLLERADNPDGTRTWQFNETPPIPTYLMAFAGGEYHVLESKHGDVPMRLYCRTSMATYMDEQAGEVFQVTGQGLDFFAGDFGFPYPFDEYNQLFVPEFNMGAMENPGCVTFNETYVFRSKPTELQRARRAETILHEMAHVYGFGDVTTMRWWGDLWLNETFATYMAHKAMIANTAYQGAWVDFANTVKSVAARQDQLRSTHPIATPCRDTDEVRQNFDGITYHKGASVLKQLVAWVGDEPFTRGVQAYFAKYRWSNATLEDFLTCIEEASGRDLDAWSKEWLQTTGLNTLRPEVTWENDRITSLAVLQEAVPEHPTMRSHRVAVGLYDFTDGALTRTERIELDLTAAPTQVAAAVGKSAAVIVVNDDDLTFAKVRFDERSRRALIENLSALADPLTRAITWAAMWDMTRDAEMPTRDYVECVIRNAATEQDVAVLERVLSQAGAAIDQFGDPGNRTDARAALAASALAQVRSSTPGSERQLVCARALVASADSDADLALLSQLLDGTEQLSGLAVDTDLRWLMLGRLASEGRADDDVINEELQRDATDFGRRRAAACLAARPTAAAKATAWDEITHGHAHLATQASIMAGFNVGAFGVAGFMQAGERQQELIRPFVPRWVAALPQVWAEKEYEEAEYFTLLLFPRVLIEQSTVETVTGAIELVRSSTLAPPTQRAAMRILDEGQDGLERALRARAVDAAAAQPASETS